MKEASINSLLTLFDVCLSAVMPMKILLMRMTTENTIQVLFIVLLCCRVKGILTVIQ